VRSGNHVFVPLVVLVIVTPTAAVAGVATLLYAALRREY